MALPADSHDFDTRAQVNAEVNKTFQLEESMAVYGLQADPFPVGECDGFFFTTDALAQHVDMLHNLVQYSDSLLLITGGAGAGKTTLLGELAAAAGDRWRICRIAGSATTSEDGIVREMMEGFGLPVRGDDERAHLGLLRAHLHMLHRSNQIALVAVDDADRLSESTRVLLLKFANDSSGHRARLLLTCEPGGLAIATNTAKGTDGVQVVELEPLSLEQTGDYVHTRLSHAGLVGDSPFTADAVRAIYKGSRGVPGAIHSLARDVLVTQAATRRRRRALGGGSGTARALRLVLAVVVLGGAAALLLERHPQLIGWSRTVSPELSVQSSKFQVPSSESQVPTPQSRVTNDESRITSNELPVQSSQFKVHSSESQTPSSASRLTDHDSPVTIHPLEPTSPVESRFKEHYEPTTRLVRAREEPPAAGKVAMPKTLVPVVTSEVHDLDWLRVQNPDQYVIQLVGTSKPSAMREFLEAHKLGSRAAWFATSRQDRVWYVIVYGLYPNKKAARAAIQTLPDELRKEQPWPRSIASIVKSTN